MVLTIASFYYKLSSAGFSIAFFVVLTIPVVYKALNYYNWAIYILVSAIASIGGVIIFCLYSNSINILTIFAGSVFSFIAFYEAYKALETAVSGRQNSKNFDSFKIMVKTI